MQLILVAHSLVQNSSNIRHRCRSLRDVEFGESRVQELRVHTNRQGVAIQTSMHMPANNTKKGVCGSNVDSEKDFHNFVCRVPRGRSRWGFFFFSLPCLRWHCENFFRQFCPCQGDAPSSENFRRSTSECLEKASYKKINAYTDTLCIQMYP